MGKKQKARIATLLRNEIESAEKNGINTWNDSRESFDRNLDNKGSQVIHWCSYRSLVPLEKIWQYTQRDLLEFGFNLYQENCNYLHPYFDKKYAKT